MYNKSLKIDGLFALVPNPQIGNLEDEALALRYWKLEFLNPHFQAGAWK